MNALETIALAEKKQENVQVCEKELGKTWELRVLEREERMK